MAVRNAAHLLIITLISSNAAKERSGLFVKYNAMYDIYGSEFLSPGGVFHCAVKCFKHEKCTGMVINGDTCVGGDIHYDSQALGLLTFVPASPVYEDPCLPFGDCPAPGTECRDGKCLCELGLSYNPSTDTCVQTCNEWGPSFQTYQLWFLKDLNFKIESDLTLEECLISCRDSTTTVCISFDYESNNRKCFLSSYSATTNPSGMNQEDYSVYGHRDCL